ncbi:folate family ECF transporter S component [Terrisporobacter sp.]|uniref:folate family ECF transporter S component n=1 Tax=Terrisporobacter sp. TaxID=1965305 RepID=UPI00262759B2|nr:folate family ECF transporter S component [Terrisporobacter sp.]
MDNKFDVKKLIQISLLIAIEVILTRFCSIQTPILRIGFGFLPIAITAMMYGPLSAGISYVIGDTLGMLLFPSGAYFPGFTLTAFLTGLTYGVFLYNKPVTWTRIIGSVLTVCLVINLGLDTYWLSIMMGKGYLALLPTRIIKSVIMIPIQALIIGIIWNKVVIKFVKISHA